MAQPKKKQTEIPGTQPDKIPEIETAAAAYVEARDERMSLTEREVARREELEAAMTKHGLTEYAYEDGEERYRVELTATEVKARVRRLRSIGTEESDDDDDAAAE
jgi:hypothetical protein